MSDRLAQLTKLYEADPTDPFVTYCLALEHAKAGRADEAVPWFDKTIDLDPLYCYAYFHKAKTLSDKGDDGAARQVLEEGLLKAKEAGDDKAQGEIAELLAAL